MYFSCFETVFFCFSCKRYKCFEKIGFQERQIILDNFNSLSSKDQQDSYLAGLISFKNVKQRRPRRVRNDEDDGDGPSFDHSVAFYYKVRTTGKEEALCHTAFLSLHGISRGRLRRIQDSIRVSCLPPCDARGKHGNRPSKTPNEILNLIRLHIKSFRGRQSHYSRRDNPEKIYLPEELTVRKMHKLFLNEVKVNASYLVYYQVFKNEFNISFGMPRTDTCAKCDELTLKINSTVDIETKQKLIQEKDLHLRKAEKFRQIKNHYKLEARAGKCMAISFDFQQNLPLPHIRTSDVFYKSQLWYYVFGIHDLADDSASMYVYTEDVAKKGANDVTSMILHYLNNKDLRHSHLVIFSDGCSGQNKNHIMVYFQYMLVHSLKLFKKVTHVFPIRGHSFLPNDQDFALIEKKKRRNSPEVPEDWDALIQEARIKPSPFVVVNMTRDMFFDIQNACSSYFLKTPRPTLGLREARIIEISSDSAYVKTKNTYSGLWTHSAVRNKKALQSYIELKKLYEQPIPINSVKIKNVISLSAFLKKPSSIAFYEKFSLTESGTNIDIDEDDNSDECE